MSRYIFVSCSCMILVLGLSFSAMADYVTITLPEGLVKQSVRDALPITIDPHNESVKGTFVIDSVSKLEMKEDELSLQGLIIGNNLVVSTKVGNQDISMKIGEFRYPLACTLSFRFDPDGKTLYVTTHLVRPEKNMEGGNVDVILPLLALIDNLEYPVPLASIRSFSAKIGQENIFIAMEPVDVKFSKSQVVLKLVPRVSKTH